MKMIQENATPTIVEPVPEKRSESVAVLQTELKADFPSKVRPCQKEEVRHILLGSPKAIQQVMHQLHVLSYAESGLWSPITTVGDELTITKEQGEAMSLLRRSV